jgi:hypothetical protein
MLNKPDDKPDEKPSTDALKEYMRIRELFTERQWIVMADAMRRVHGRAVERGVHQTLTITFNEKGSPRYLKASDDVEMRP